LINLSKLFMHSLDFIDLQHTQGTLFLDFVFYTFL
jgi:hypothetical protein